MHLRDCTERASDLTPALTPLPCHSISGHSPSHPCFRFIPYLVPYYNIPHDPPSHPWCLNILYLLPHHPIPGPSLPHCCSVSSHPYSPTIPSMHLLSQLGIASGIWIVLMSGFKEPEKCLPLTYFALSFSRCRGKGCFPKAGAVPLRKFCLNFLQLTYCIKILTWTTSKANLNSNFFKLFHQLKRHKKELLLHLSLINVLRWVTSSQAMQSSVVAVVVIVELDNRKQNRNAFVSSEIKYS